MSNSLFRFLNHLRSALRAASHTHSISLIQIHPYSSSLASNAIKASLGQHSSKVNYLMKSCGLTLEKAESVSKYCKPESANNPKLVMEFFKSRGLSETGIIDIVKRLPIVLTYNVNKTLMPKFEFFKSKGISTDDIGKILRVAPYILRYSVENRIARSFDYLKDLLQSNEKAISAVKRCPTILTKDVENCVIPNVRTLEEAGVPRSNIIMLVTHQPRDFINSNDVLKKTVKEVEDMGFDPSRLKFMLAVHARRAMSKLTWDRKFEVYKQWGWSEEEIFESFAKHPWCLTYSESKIMRVMDFLVNKMGFKSSLVQKRPVLMSLSLNQRIIPRCLFYQALLMRGLIKDGDISLAKLLESPEPRFLKRLVYSQGGEATALLQLYEEKKAHGNQVSH